MGLLNETQQSYYNGNDFGSYQFISLYDIITQFEFSYVGEDKIIPKIKRADIAFYAQRALQELSFDTLKSIKGQEIVVPATFNNNEHSLFTFLYVIQFWLVKFGAKRSSDSTKKPGASAASARDVSAAERSKCIYISSYNLVATGRMWLIFNISSSVKFGKSSEAAASMPGAKSANDSDVSNAERG